MKSKLIKVLNNSPSRIKETFDENSDGDEEGQEEDMGTPNPFSPVKSQQKMSKAEKRRSMSVDKSMLSKEVPRFTSPEPSRSKKDLLISSPDKTKNLRVFTPQRRHHFSPIRKTMKAPKITRIVEGHLMPFRDTSGSRKK